MSHLRSPIGSTLSVLAIVCAAQFIVILNATTVVVALPSIERDLAFVGENLTWVVNTYLLVFGGFLLLGGRSADLFGRKRVFVSGVSIFTLASVLGGFATSPGALLIARALQGLGAAAVIPATQSIVIVSFPDGPRRRRALSIWAAVISIAGSVAFFVGGALTDSLSWRAIFFANVPLGLITIAAAFRWMRDSRSQIIHSLDIGGAFSVTVGSAVLIYMVFSGRRGGWVDRETLGAAVAAVVLLAIFLIIERAHREPLVRLSIFRARRFAVATGVISVMSGAMMATSYMISLYFQNILGLSPLVTGLAFLPTTLALSIAALVTHSLVQRIGAHVPLSVALLLLASGAAVLSRIGTNSAYLTTALPALAVMYVGVGCAGVTLAILATTNLPESDAGLASGLMATARQMGGGVWLAVFSSIAAARTAMSPALGDAAVSLVDGYRLAFWCMAALVTLTAAFTLIFLHPRWIS